MTLLVLALVVFGYIHLIPALPDLKSDLKHRVGKAYGPLYGVASLASLVLMIAALRHADRIDLYAPPMWGRHANFGLTLAGFLCLGIFLFRGSWRATLRYPMALAIMFWGVGHLLANGDLATVVFVVGLMGLAALQVLLHSRLVPVVTLAPRDGHNLLSLLFGVALYGLMAQLHGVLIGVPVFNISP
jgi:uncharacterized membrane protein